MDLYSTIFTRKSTRNFKKEALQETKLMEIEDFIRSISPLLPNAEITYKLVGPEGVKGVGVPKAPHYLLIYGKEQPLRDACAGFLFQHVDLFLFSQGYASRWVGMMKPTESDEDYIIGLAFGEPVEPEVRRRGDFERKSLKEISEGTDPRIEAARVAPSGLNGQPWYFIANNGAIYVYRKKKINGLPGIMYKLTELDVGIALCHLAVATEHSGKEFEFVNSKGAPSVSDGYFYIGTVK